MSRRIIDWTSIIKRVQHELIEYDKRNIKPTLRAMFYKLYSLGLLRNTRSDYVGLSDHTADARENSITGKGTDDEKLSPDCFLDETHSVVQIDDVYRSPEERIKYHTDKLIDLPKEYRGLPRWFNQPDYVEIWIEKNAMVAEFDNIINQEGLEVRLVPHGGYVSFTFLLENVQRLVKSVREGKKGIHILYFGDWDPSGEQMFDDIKDRLSRIWKLKNGSRHQYKWKYKKGKWQETEFEFSIELIAVTKKQVEDHDLPSEPLDDTMRAKLARDRRTPAFTDKHGAVYQSELDALPIFIPDEFRRMVVNSVNKYFDEDIYGREIQAHKKEHSEKAIKKLVKDKLAEFYEELSKSKSKSKSSPDKSAKTKA